MEGRRERKGEMLKKEAYYTGNDGRDFLALPSPTLSAPAAVCRQHWPPQFRHARWILYDGESRVESDVLRRVHLLLRCKLEGYGYLSYRAATGISISPYDAQPTSHELYWIVTIGSMDRYSYSQQLKA